jgi:hypothetical protein
VSGGLLIAGRVVPVPGLTIRNPLDTEWCRLSVGDYRARHGRVNKAIWHTTKGIDPQRIVPGAGPDGKDKLVADFYRGDPAHNAAPLVIDCDGSVACLADLATTCAFHATTANDSSVGIEMYQLGDGTIYQATLDAAALLAPALSEALDFPFQFASDTWIKGRIIERLKNGGTDCVGHFGHRDQAWMFPEHITDPATRAKYPNGYACRGRGDPGDAWYQAMIAAGAEPLKFRIFEDITLWKRRQIIMNSKGARLAVDGIPGPATMAAMRRLGYRSGRDIVTA